MDSDALAQLVRSIRDPAAQRATDSGDHAWCNTNRDTNRTTWLSRGEIHRRGQPAGVPSVSKEELRRRSSLTQRRKTAGKTKVLQDVSTRFVVGDERHHPQSRVATGTDSRPGTRKSPVASKRSTPPG